MQNRESARLQWVQNQLKDRKASLWPLNGDASFRQYFRCQSAGQTYVLMDAPPDKEPIGPFIKAASMFAQWGVHVPEIYKLDEGAGFVLLEDFGDTLMLQALTNGQTDRLYRQAIDQLLQIQAVQVPPSYDLEPFDAAFMRLEMQRMIDWFLEGHLQKNCSAAEKTMLADCFQDIAEKAARQTRVLIHRDFHSRNLMVLDRNPALGVIDFQDAMAGPYTYDLASLLKDCYIAWERPRQLYWLQYYVEHSPVAAGKPFAQITADYDLCGLQRHLKILGIFSRLHLRDGKSGFLKDIPLALAYVLECLEINGWYPALFEFLQRIHLP